MARSKTSRTSRLRDSQPRWLHELKVGWFQEYFSNKSGSPEEKSSLAIVDPKLLDLHLSHSYGLKNGPIIQRTGNSSPVMEDPEQPGTYTSDPELQRIGSYYILEKRRPEHIWKVYCKFVGCYILYGFQLFRTDPATAKTEAVLAAIESLQPYYANPGGFPTPPDLRPTQLASDIRNFVEPLLEFLRQNEPTSSTLAADLENIINIAIAADKSFTDPLDVSYAIYPDYIIELKTLIETEPFKSSLRRNVVKYLRLLIRLLRTPSHEKLATKKNSSPIVLMQGCGDLTMNEWNVAFLSGNSFKGVKGEWDLLHAPGELLNDRTYTCLLKWSCSEAELASIAHDTRIVYPYQIARVRFKAPSLDIGPPDRHVFLNGHPIGHLIEFAVYGQQVVNDGEPVRLQSSIREYADLRHIFKFPNLNRSTAYTIDADRAGIPDYGEMPRNLFNRNTRDDVWLGEYSLLSGDRNLRVAAIEMQIQLALDRLGAPKEWIEIVLQKEGYRESTSETLSPGKWRWVTEGRETWLDIRFLTNQYPCTMIGVKAEDEEPSDKPASEKCVNEKVGIVQASAMFFMAHGHNYNDRGCTIEESARFMLSKGSWNTLLFDEGNDVFQVVDKGMGNGLEEVVPLKRDELRCVFWANART